MTDYRGPLAAAIEAAREAGALLRTDFHRPDGPRGAGDHADADEEAERLIRAKLLAAFPYAYRGEETGSAPGADGTHLWLVDPNDGTSAYLKGWRGSAVSIGLLRDGVPVLGVVYAFCYPDGGGDLIAWAEGCGPIARNGAPVQVNLGDGRLDRGARVFVSQEADRNPIANADCVQPARYVALPSIAYRLARAAVGEGVAAVSLSAPGAWDYAAGHALLRAAGGILIDQDGNEVTYGSDGASSTRWCFGGAAEAVRELCRRNWHQALNRLADPEPPFCLVRPVRGRTVTDDGMLSRAQGCLLGQFAGDSLGGLVEFKSAGTIADHHPSGLRDLRDGGTWNNLAGQLTDDSELALMLARTLLHYRTYDPARVLDAYVRWFDDPQTFDVGGTTSQALGAASHADGEDRVQRALMHASRSSQANGSLMRISPLGILGAGRGEEATTWAHADSQLTHPHPVCQDACAVFVAALAHAIAHGDTPGACYEAALAEASKPGVHLDVLATVELARTAPPATYSHQMGWVRIALQNAFYQLLHAPTFEEGVVDTVMRGGDTDTNGAIAGALLGAVHGRAAVPARWQLALLSCRPLRNTPTAHPRAVEFWPVDVLHLAEALLCLGR